MVWMRCLEFLAIVVVAGVAIAATIVALAAVTRAWRNPLPCARPSRRRRSSTTVR